MKFSCPAVSNREKHDVALPTNGPWTMALEIYLLNAAMS
jgi:hypothetical protein